MANVFEPFANSLSGVWVLMGRWWIRGRWIGWVSMRWTKEILLLMFDWSQEGGGWKVMLFRL
jgi:hypothetical protein